MGKGEYNHVSVSDTGHIFYQMFLCSRDYNNRDQNAQYTTQPLSDLNFIYNVRSVSALLKMIINYGKKFRKLKNLLH